MTSQSLCLCIAGVLTLNTSKEVLVLFHEKHELFELRFLLWRGLVLLTDAQAILHLFLQVAWQMNIRVVVCEVETDVGVQFILNQKSLVKLNIPEGVKEAKHDSEGNAWLVATKDGVIGV